MKKLLLTLCALFVLTHNQPAYANEVIVTNEDVLVDSETVKDIDVSTDKGSTFLVEVPILSKVSSTFDWKAYAYGDVYWETSVRVYGDLISNEQLRISFDEDIIMSPDGGLKESITWTGCMDAKSLFKDTYDATELSDNQTWDSVACHIKPNPDTTAGLWRGYIKVNVFLEPKEYMLTAEQFKLYVEDDNTVSSVTIPEYVNIDGVEHRVAGLVGECFYDFNNLRDIYLPDVPRFKISKAFANTGNSNYAGDITIHGSGELYLDGYSDMNVSIKVDGCTLFLSQNPFNGYNGSPPSVEGTYNYYHYGEVNQYDFSSIIGGDYILGQWGDVTLNPEFQTLYGSGFNNCIIDKLTVPMLKYADGSWWSTFYGCEVREVVMDNSFIGDNWFENCTVLKKVTLTDNVKYICQNAFAGCTSLDEVIIPESVEHIDPTAFTNTPFLENLKKGVEKVYINGIFICYGDKYVQGSYLEFPADLDILSVDTVFPTVTHLAFEETDKPFSFAGNPSFNKVTTLDLTNRRLNGYSSYVYFPNVTKLIVGGKTTSFPDYVNKNTLKEIEFTEGFESIGHYCFNHITGYEGSSFYIPASVFQIGGYSTAKQYPYGGNYGDRYGSGWGNHVFYNFGKDGVFKSFDVEDSSIYYTDVDGILYTKDLQALVAVPRAYEFENGVFELPNETRRLGELSFSRNPHVRELVISDNLEIFNNEDELEDYYNSIYCDNISVLNKGNSLSLATYQFTNIQKFTTRPTNPNYTSIDGILYTKDLKELVAVPNHYQGAVVIPEGCEKIRENAFWIDYEAGGVHNGVTSISIPASMKNIDAKQLDYINYRWASRTTVAKDCRTYVRFGGRTLVVSDMSNIKYNGGTGTLWFNSSNGNVGTDPAPAWARYEPFFLSGGEYIISFNNPSPEKTVRYNGVLANGDGISITLNAATTKIQYTCEPTELTVGEKGVIVFFNGIFVDTTNNNQAIYGNMTTEMANEIIGLINIHKHDYQLKEHVDVTCANDGYDLYECSCGKSYSDIYESLEHTFADGTCSICGNTDVYHESAEAGVYDKYGALTSSWDELVNEGLIEIENGNELISVSTDLEGKIVVPENITVIGTGAFKDSKFSDIVLPDGLTHITNYAFQNSRNLKSIDIPDGAVVWNYAFMSCASLETVKLGNTVDYIGISTFQDCTSLKEIVIPSSVKSINRAAFERCSNLEKAVLPEGLTKLDESAFKDCIKLTDVNLPSTVTVINAHAFRSTSITEFTWPDCISVIGRWTFQGTKIKSFVIPSTVTTIKDNAFANMTELEAVYFEGDTLPTIDKTAFKKSSGKMCTFYFRNKEAAEAFTTEYYNESYGQVSDNFDW